MRYIKFPTTVWYKAWSDKGKLSKEEYFALTSIRASIVLLWVSLAHSKISAIYFDWEKKITFGWVGNYLNAQEVSYRTQILHFKLFS
jgi:hypothetical protein